MRTLPKNRQLDRKAMTVKELAEQYVKAMEAGLIMGKGGRPKRPSTIYTNIGALNGHIIPLIGQRRVRDLTKADVTKMMNDVIAGKTRRCQKDWQEARCFYSARRSWNGEQMRRPDGSMLTYAINIGIIEHNVAHGIRKPKDQVRDRRLSDDEYRVLGKMLREAGEDHELAPTIAITRLLALTGCRRGEILGLKLSEIDFENSCLRLADLKEGASARPIGLPVIELLEERRKTVSGDYVFPGTRASQTFGSFPNHWNRIFGGPRISRLHRPYSSA